MSDRTICNYHAGLQAYGRFLEKIGLDDVTEVTPAILERYRTFLFESKNRHGEQLSIGTQIQSLCALNRFYATLVEKGIVLVNIAEKLPMPQEPQRLPKRLPSAKEVERLLARMPTKTPFQFRDRTIVETFYATGVRQAELSGLRVSDADLKRKELYVIGKGLKDRTLPLTTRCADCLGEYVPKVRPMLPPSPLLFPTKSGSRLEARSLIEMASAQLFDRFWGKTMSELRQIGHTVSKHGATLRLQYGTQTGVKPPRFTFFANHPRLSDDNFQRYLENRMRESFDLTGTPVMLKFRQKD